MTKRGRRRGWSSGSVEKKKRNERIVRRRDVDKLSWPAIARKEKITHQRAIAVYQREKERLQEEHNA